MSNVIALIPARAGSKGIKDKNFRLLAGGPSCLERAIECAQWAGIAQRIVSTDSWPLVFAHARWQRNIPDRPPLDFGQHSVTLYLERPAALAQDDTPMIDVVKHALDAIPGAPDDIWLLVQPTQPLRKPEHLREAVRLLRETPEAESVVSVVPLPLAHHPDFVLSIEGGHLWNETAHDSNGYHLWFPDRRQDVGPAYIRDGTVYAFYRATIERRNSIYGHCSVPLIIDPQDTCELDTPEQWDALEARLKAPELSGQPSPGKG
jgi:CMP-N,N'-diacetyllegionaminic acid synthase